MTRTWFARLLTLITLTGACAATPGPAAARAPYSVDVEDAHGRPLRSYRHRGKTYVLGELGQRYVIRVTNHTARRVEAVVTVDGRDVLTGEVGDFEGQRGYVVDPHGVVRIEGFRKSLHGVAAFRFSSPGDSYSSRMGTPENLGIIGAAFFEERPRRPRPPDHVHIPRRPQTSRQSSAEGLGNSSGNGRSHRAPAADAESATPTPRRRSESKGTGLRAESEARRDHGRRGGGYDDHSRIGTEYGEHRHSLVREVTFRRRSPGHPDRILTLRYDDAPGLRARGIVLYPPAPRRPHGPQAFPVSRFAPPPPTRTY